MSTIRIELKMTGSTAVTLDRGEYEEARRQHEAGNVGRLDRMLGSAIRNMSTEVTVIELEPDGAEYEL